MTLLNPLDLTGKTVMVTGASKGIGRATAVYLSKLGARVIGVARNRVALEELSKEMQGSGHVMAPFDLNDLDEIPIWMKSLAKEHGRIYGLVHSAGNLTYLPLKSLQSKHIAPMMRVNFEAALMLAKGFRQKDVRSEEGPNIVMISSVAAERGHPAMAIYSATKGALNSLCRCLAVELSRENIRVNCVCPAVVQTDMLGGFQTITLPEQQEKLFGGHRLGLGMPDDVAYATAFLLGAPAKWITGTMLTIDGGATA